jgi:hypothetical protein
VCCRRSPAIEGSTARRPRPGRESARSPTDPPNTFLDREGVGPRRLNWLLSPALYQTADLAEAAVAVLRTFTVSVHLSSRHGFSAICKPLRRWIRIVPGLARRVRCRMTGSPEPHQSLRVSVLSLFARDRRPASGDPRANTATGSDVEKEEPRLTGLGEVAGSVVGPSIMAATAASMRVGEFLSGLDRRAALASRITQFSIAENALAQHTAEQKRAFGTSLIHALSTAHVQLGMMSVDGPGGIGKSAVRLVDHRL